MDITNRHMDETIELNGPQGLIRNGQFGLLIYDGTLSRFVFVHIHDGELLYDLANDYEMANNNYLGTKWRSRRNHGTYTVKDQSEAAEGVPNIPANAILTLEADTGRTIDPVNYQMVITIRAGAIQKFFTPLRTVNPMNPTVEDASPATEGEEKESYLLYDSDNPKKPESGEKDDSYLFSDPGLV